MGHGLESRKFQVDHGYTRQQSRSSVSKENNDSENRSKVAARLFRQSLDVREEIGDTSFFPEDLRIIHWLTFS